MTRFLRNDLAEEVLGDLDEKFYETVKSKSAFTANVNYWYEAINYLRPFALRKSKQTHLNQYDMFQSYFKIGWRNLTNQRMYSAIKIGGFAIGIASCLLIALFIKDELSYDKQYPDGARIYRVLNAWDYQGEKGAGDCFQAPFANALKDDYPEIEMAGRYNPSELFGAGSKQMRPVDKVENTYEEGFVYMDQELLQMLNLPMIFGNPAHCLDEPRTLVITRSKAEKYFPNENPIGKLVILDNDPKPYKIGGVIENLPSNTHLQFDFLMTLKGVEFWPGEQTYWGATNYPTYIKVRSGTDAFQLEKKLTAVVEKYLLPHWIKDGVSDTKGLAKATTFKLQPIKDIYLRSEGIDDLVKKHGDIRFVWLFGAVAGFILLIAGINFINLSTAKSANRAKEVGLRKTVGSYRSDIINQFLTESLLFSLLSFLIGVILAWTLLPYFNLLAAKSIIFPWTEWYIYPILILAACLIGILAGVYPSFYLSSFTPIQVLKGNVSKGSKNSFTRSSLVVFQFTTSIILIIATFVIYQQVEYILHKKVGFDKEQVLLIQGTNTLEKNVTAFKNELLELSQIKSASVSDYLPIKGTKRNGNGFWNEGKNTTEKSVGGQIWQIDHDYLRTLGIKLVEGRNFSPEMLTDSSAIIINQKMAKELGLSDPVGKRIQSWQGFTIVGVVEDFHFESLRDKIEPLALILGGEASIVSVKVNSKEMAAVIQSITGVWKKFAPDQPIRYTFLDESFARMYDDVQRMGRIFTTFAVLAVIVACLGLFALSAFMVEQRSKEISIRLVLGASLNSIFNMLTFNFVKLVLISILIATPIAWYLMKKWLEDFSYRTEITWQVFALAGVIAIAIALFTISYQSIKAALMKPVDSLKSE